MTSVKYYNSNLFSYDIELPNKIDHRILLATRRSLLVKQEKLTLPERLSSLLVLFEDRVIFSLVFCVVLNVDQCLCCFTG